MPIAPAMNGCETQSSPASLERERMKSYWKIYSPSLESMMLNNDAQYLAENEQNELLSYLPSYRGQRVLELGAGIGRFTSRFAYLANHVTAVDFIESYIEENKRVNKHHKNITFRCADATKLDFEENSFDLIFTNWLFMYLTNSEVEAVFSKILRWLSPNGHFFIRESCYHPSGNVFRPENPTKYRTPLEYIKILLESTTEKSHFRIKFAKNVLTYIHYYGNPNQLCILVQKKNEKRKFLERHLSDPKICLSHHQLLGPIFKDSGVHSIKSIGGRLSIQSGQRILHFGCDIGEIALQLVETFNCFVHGLDTSMAKIHTAIERQGKLPLDIRKKMQYEYVAELSSSWTLPMEGYEAILCTDILNQFSDAHLLVRRLKEILKPGGRIFIADYFTTDLPVTIGDHISSRFLGENEMGSILKKEGFHIEQMESDSDCAIITLKKRRNAFFNELEEDVKPLFADLDDKISGLESGNLKWTKFVASM